MVDITGSMVVENNKRIEVLYRGHHNWLLACGKNISKSEEVSEDLVGDLYLYLGNKINPNIWYADSFNLQYCRAFLSSRFINFIKKQNKVERINPYYDREEETYDEDLDKRVEEEYGKLVSELEQMKQQKGWQSAMLFSIYYFGDRSYNQLAKEIGISKSTVFLNARKVKQHMVGVLRNPFIDEG
jgi:RNA polymerase sigma factor (sigma-70 family)